MFKFGFVFQEGQVNENTEIRYAVRVLWSNISKLIISRLCHFLERDNNKYIY